MNISILLFCLHHGLCLQFTVRHNATRTQKALWVPVIKIYQQSVIFWISNLCFHKEQFTQNWKIQSSSIFIGYNTFMKLHSQRASQHSPKSDWWRLIVVLNCKEKKNDETSPAFPSAWRWVDNDCLYIFGWMVPSKKHEWEIIIITALRPWKWQ